MISLEDHIDKLRLEGDSLLADEIERLVFERGLHDSLVAENKVLEAELKKYRDWAVEMAKLIKEMGR